MKNTDLITVPSFVFGQGEIGDEDFEQPISVEYYRSGTIVLRQSGHYDKDEEIVLSPQHFERLFKLIKKNLPEALDWLEKH